MKPQIILKGMLATMAAISCLAAAAQIESRPVKFAPGKSSTVIKSVIKGEKIIDYKVGASAGQTLTVALTATNSANYFNIMEPGEDAVAIYNSSIDGNKATKTLEKDGSYTIRVYLMRSAARRNESGSYNLAIAVSGAAEGADAKVKGTPYHATGKLKAAMGDATMGSTMADFGVIRSGGGSAVLDVTPDGGFKRTLKFTNGKWTAADAESKVSATKTGDNWDITVNNYEHYEVPEAVVFGG